MTHVNETLHHDHEQVDQLITKLKQTTGGSEKTRASLCQQIKEEIQAHTEFEEKVFYPAVREARGQAREEVEAAIEEHTRVEQMLDDIAQMEPTSPEFMRAVEGLEQAIHDHVRREEEKIFPMAQEAIEARQADEMTERHDQMAAQHRH